MPAAEPKSACENEALDPAAIMAAVGEAAYVWSIGSDELTWAPNAGDVLAVSDVGVISTGRGFAKLVDPDTTVTRYDAVMGSTPRDEGAGVPYQIQYALRANDNEPRRWIEGTGR